jgi:hypothetical protein
VFRRERAEIILPPSLNLVIGNLKLVIGYSGQRPANPNLNLVSDSIGTTWSWAWVLLAKSAMISGFFWILPVDPALYSGAGSGVPVIRRASAAEGESGYSSIMRAQA